MSRLDEELDYRNEANNIQIFSDLYSHRRATSNNKVRVVVPQVLEHLCTDNVLVMEWIDGSKLTDVDPTDPNQVKENLALIQLGIECTLSQLLETGILHADPHSANLIKVPNDDGTGSQLGYLDFGLLSSVPESVRDALVCSVAQLVFARDVEAVASLFGELQLLPEHVVEDRDRSLALARALEKTFQQVLVYPEQSADDMHTRVPHLKFDRLLESLAGILPEFEFQLPPYFLSNCRALAIMEGNARMLDPQFSVLKVLYPYALNRLLLNPSDSPVVEGTLWSLMTDPRTDAVDHNRVMKLLDDSAALTGYSRRKVVLDILRSRKGRQVARSIAVEVAKTRIAGRQRRRWIETSSYFRL
jgi:predicted unusual protein kinase regulating ubiquinone biosynthesis (AarF/ABC1/UbiB family)